MSKREDWDDTGVVHVRDLDVSERRRVTPAEREVLGLLGLDDGQPWVRLSLAMWSRGTLPDRGDRVTAEASEWNAERAAIALLREAAADGLMYRRPSRDTSQRW